MVLDEFEQHIRDILSHMYDPSYRPSGHIVAIFDCSSQKDEIECIWKNVVQAIESLKPAPDIPVNTRAWRIYNVLSYRYTKGLTQEETAEQLSITTRHLRREQQHATRLLARRIWEQRYQATESNVTEPSDSHDAPSVPPMHSQIQQELEALHGNSPGMVGDVQTIIQRVIKLIEVLVSGREIELNVDKVPSSLRVTLHPSVLFQILIKATQGILHHMLTGKIELHVESLDETIRIFICGGPVTTPFSPAEFLETDSFLTEVLTESAGSARIYEDDNRICFDLELRACEQANVLIIDDNMELVHFFTRYTMNTKYHIHHVGEGQKALTAVSDVKPDIIVLDVMLPDIDGWTLLTNIRNNPTTESIPVVVCSVTRGDELALALGANLYLPKPVGRQQFLQALDHVTGLPH